MLQGLIVDLITPLNEAGSLDGRGLGRHLDRVLPFASGILLASPSAGEGSILSPSQRQELLEKASVIIRGQIPILVWITQTTEEGTKKTLRHLNDAIGRKRYEGPVFWVDTPLCYHSNRGLPELYREMLAVTDRPFILHNDPRMVKELGRYFKRENIRTSVLKELVELEQVAGLIYLGAFERVYHYQRASRRKPLFRIYDGDEARFLEHPSTGGVVSVGANLAPRAWQIITESSLRLTGEEDYPDRAGQLWKLGQYVRDLLDAYKTMPAPLIKEALSEFNVIEKPAFPLRENRGEFESLLNELMLRYEKAPFF